MRWSVSVWKFADSPVAEIQAEVDATDCVAAALSVLDRFGLRFASTVMVSSDCVIVGQFVDVDLSSSSAASAACVVSYDYDL